MKHSDPLKGTIISILVLVNILSCSNQDVGPQPVNPHASEETVEVFQLLHTLPRGESPRVLSGHLAGGAVSPNVDIEVCENYYFKWDEINYIDSVTGHVPAVLCIDIAAGFFESERPLETQLYFEDCLRGVRKHWKNGGLIMATTHCMNPIKLDSLGGGVRDRFEIRKIFTPGNQYYENYRILLAKFGDFFAELEKEDIVVIWRPYNEIGHAWKWWCRNDPEDFKALWEYTFNYFTNERKLSNLLWQWDSHIHQGKELEMKYYPGDEFVDIVGVSVYTDEGGSGFSDRINPMPEKVFSIAEIGPKGVISGVDGWNIIQRDFDWRKITGWIKENHPYASFFVTWDRTWGPYGRAVHLDSAYNDPWIMHLEEFKKLRP